MENDSGDSADIREYSVESALEARHWEAASILEDLAGLVGERYPLTQSALELLSDVIREALDAIDVEMLRGEPSPTKDERLDRRLVEELAEIGALGREEEEYNGSD